MGSIIPVVRTKDGIQTPLPAYARSLAEEGFAIGDVAESDYDDPSLALMYARIRSMSLQTIKGSSMISGQTEFNFVAQMTRVFCRMGALPDGIFIILLTVLCRLPRSRSLPGVIVVLRTTTAPTTAFERSWVPYRSFSLPYEKKIVPRSLKEAIFDDHRHRRPDRNARAGPDTISRESIDSSDTALVIDNCAGRHGGPLGYEPLTTAHGGTTEAYRVGYANADREERRTSARI